MMAKYVCGFYYVKGGDNPRLFPLKYYLPQVDLSVHATIISSTSRTSLRQKFVNPSTTEPIPELRYTFPIYDGVSVVAFKCTINKDRVIHGVVKEKHKARQDYQKAVRNGKAAALLEQLPDASDVFTTTVGNVPAGAELVVELVYLGELKHDAEVDGVRFTIPAVIAPRYGSLPSQLGDRPPNAGNGKLDIVVDAEMPVGCNIKSIQSPSHPISVNIGTLSTAADSDQPSLHKASATLALGSAELEKDFIIHVVAANTGEPVAVLETHPTIPSQRALMTTLVPKFTLPPSRPEIVFLCDRSGSMGLGHQIPNLKSALQLFLCSLPVGVKFNICSFGSHHTFLFPEGSRSYDKGSLDEALRHVKTFEANYGGTEMYAPLEDTFKRRYQDMDLEVFLLTDGEIWNQVRLFDMVNKYVAESDGAIRLMTLGIGMYASHSLIEGLARAGNGFSQSVGKNENMNSKVIRMLKASLMPHVTDYSLEIHYADPHKNVPGEGGDNDNDDDYEVVEKVMEGLTIDGEKEGKEVEAGPVTKATSLFDPNIKEDTAKDTAKSQNADNKYAQVPPIEHPKLLQAPFKIPALFPFNRTTVYVHLSPETCQQPPRSITLKATSKHGPLRLDVPITILPEKGETIHQLGARKAIQELEEGRGWLFHATDDSGKLLKEKLEGRFSDMIERECVRLGVQYQVAGKYCSFVAVEGNKMASKKDRETHRPLAEGEAMRTAPAITSEEEGEVEDEDEEMGFGFFDVDRSDMRSDMRTAPVPPPPAAPMFTWGSPFGGPASPSVATPFSASASPGVATPCVATLFGASAPSSARFSARASAPTMRKSMNASDTRCLVGRVDRDVAEEDDDEDDLPQDHLQSIIMLQSFDGSWTCSDKLVKLLGVTENDIEAALANGSGSLVKNDITITAAVVACLRKKFADKEDEWDMVVEKAMDWLREKAGPDAEVLVQSAEPLFSNE